MQQQIKDEQLQARKNRDVIKINLLTTLLGDIIRVGKDRGNRPTTDEETLLVVKKYLKNIEEFLVLSKDATKTESLLKEKEILLNFLPKQASLEEVATVVGANFDKPKGEIFRILKEKFGNNFDPKIVQELLKNN